MVRQKRIPTILAQALIVPTTENLGVPIMNFDLGSNKVFGEYDYYVPSFHGKDLVKMAIRNQRLYRVQVIQREWVYLRSMLVQFVQNIL